MKISHDKITRKGALAILFAFVLGMTANTIAIQFWSDSHDQFAVAHAKGEGFRAHMLAQAGLQAAINALTVVPEEYLFTSGLALSPPDLLVEGCKPKCFISYRLQPENGRINVNNLVRSDDKVSVEYKTILQRLFSQFQIPMENVDALTDWIDENDSIEGVGAESYFYTNLTPPVKIKNYPLFSLSEICQVRGFDYSLVYGSRMPPGWLERQKELSFQTEDEKNLLSEEDWVLANHLTAFIDPDIRTADKININAARYHVLMSLSDSMSKEAVLGIFKLRRKNDNYIKSLESLQSVPELMMKTPGGVTLYEELVGTGGGLSGFLTTTATIYRIVGVGSILSGTDNKESVVKRITILYNKVTKKIIYYAED